MKHIVALSGGKDSTAMALRLAEVEPREYEYVCTPTGNELPTMLAHWDRLGELLGTPIKSLSSGHTLGGLIAKWNALPNWRQRWCTRVLKIEPFQAYLLGQTPCSVYVGIRADEAEDREGAGHDAIEGVTERYPLVEWGWGLRRVKEYLVERGVAIPQRTDCAACFFQRLPEWYALWRDYPEEFARAEAYEDLTGHTFRSPSRDSWPTSLREMRARFEAGEIPKGRARMEDRGVVMCGTCAR